MSPFVEIVKTEFAFLEQEYGFLRVDPKRRSQDDGVFYFNRANGVALQITHEAREAMVFVTVYRLVAGEVRRNSYPLARFSDVTEFDFGDVLPPQEMMRPAYEYGENSEYYLPDGLRRYVAANATRLRKYGREILSGDFSILPVVAEKIMHRDREHQRRFHM